ncbi:MAG TPA: hypothetical protein VMU85_05795, partial [Stellaceae bacterium]|nr:hypothetical protein [Stellaceae bacterium]
DLRAEYGLLMHLDQGVADILNLIVSRENSCRFCYAATRMMLRAQGMSETRIARLEQNLGTPDGPGPRAAAVIAFGRAQSRTGPAGAREAREALRHAGCGEDELKEIAFAVAMADFFNRLHSIPAISARAMERMPDFLPMRLLGPLLNHVMVRRRQRGQAAAPARPPLYPYARLVEAYAGSPIAPTLAATIEGLWASPLLSRRCKLLMLAVVARGLGCAACADEIAAALEREGMSQAVLAQVLTHLDAAELDATERLLVRFTRETIWFEPATLQRRARALREQLAVPQLVEAIGVASLANGLCRMGAMVLEH